MGNRDNIQKWVDYYAFQLYEESQGGDTSLSYQASPIEGIHFWRDIKGFENVEFTSPLGTRIKFLQNGHFVLNDREI